MWRGSLLPCFFAVAVVICFAMASKVRAEATAIQLTGGPVFRSEPKDMVVAWRACQAAVSHRALHPDKSALQQLGWEEVPVTLNGKLLTSVFAKGGTQAMIYLNKNSCSVGGNFADQPALEALRAQLSEEFETVARERKAKAQSWVTDGEPRFSVGGLVSVISTRHTMAETLGGNLEGTIPVGILVADGSGSDK